jgi:hypothetical protein
MRDGKTKIVVRISDGLGNQLFQFALGKYLADKLGCEMVFDKTHFMLSRYRRFLLDKFLGPNKIKRWGFFKELLFIPLWCVKVKFGDNVFRKVLKFLGIKWLKVRSPFLFQDEFSDFENAVFVSGNEDAPYEDIRLMSLCKHHIIASSTFSWWGAYLGDDSGMTIYPRPWFKGLEMPSSCVPSKWVAVSSE